MGEVYKLDLPRAERDVLLALADNANDDGGDCFPGVDLLAWKLDCSIRKIQYTLRALEIKGAISVLNNKNGGRGKHPEYQLNLSAVPLKGAKTSSRQTPKGCKNEQEKGAKTDIGDSERVQNQTQKGANFSIKGANSDIKGAKTSIAYKEETSVETPIEPSGETPSTNLEPVGSAVKLGDLFGFFSAEYEKIYGLPYRPSDENRKADFGQLKKLVEQYGEKFSIADWQDFAVINYLDTPQASHTLKDLATRYATFRRSALNEFGKPTVKNKASPFGAKTAQNVDVFKRFLEKGQDNATSR